MGDLKPGFAFKKRTEPKPVGLDQFQFGPISVCFQFFLKKKLAWLFFLIKTKPN
jgi:hypothetical protein